MSKLNELDKYREGNRLEAKKAVCGFPKSLWETYSATFHAWKKEGWKTPVLEEQFNPDRTTLTLTLSPQESGNMAIKSGDKTKTAISKQKKRVIIQYLTVNPLGKSGELSALIGVNSSRTKVYLQELVADGFIIAEGANRNRTYRLKERG